MKRGDDNDDDDDDDDDMQTLEWCGVSRSRKEERSGKRETDLVGIFRAKFYIGLMDIAVTDTTHGYHVSQVACLEM